MSKKWVLSLATLFAAVILGMVMFGLTLGQSLEKAAGKNLRSMDLDITLMTSVKVQEDNGYRYEEYIWDLQAEAGSSAAEAFYDAMDQITVHRRMRLPMERNYVYLTGENNLSVTMRSKEERIDLTLLTGSHSIAVSGERDKLFRISDDSAFYSLEAVVKQYGTKRAGGAAASEKYVDVNDILGTKAGAFETMAFFAQVKIGGYTASYEAVQTAASDVLRDAIGQALEGEEGWYRVSGHSELQYLIREYEGNYSLWEFDCFERETYPYADVLETIYNITDAEVIAEIRVSPPLMDNTPAGQAVQEEIGNYSVSDEKEIRAFYEALTAMTCLSTYNWDLIDLGEYSEEGMLNQVRTGRYLTLVTVDGRQINTLKYTSHSGMFYEFGGIAYSKLAAEQKEEIDRILKME